MAIAIVIAIGIVAERSTSSLAAEAEWVSHTHFIKESLEAVRAQIRAAESSRRGYSLSRDPRLLDDYHAAAKALPPLLARLATLTEDNPAQARRVEALDAAVDARLRRMQVTLDAAPAEPRLRTESRTSLGFDLTTRVETALGALEEEENRLLARRTAGTAASARRARLAIAIGAFAEIAIVAAVALLLRAEAVRRATAERALRDENGLLESVLASIGDGVVVCDENARMVRFNPAAERTIGLGKDDGPPQEWGDRYGVFRPDMRTPIPVDEYPLVRAVRGEDTDDVEQHIVNPAVPAGVLISVTGRPLRDPVGAVRGGVVVFRDVTRQRRAEARIRDLNHELEQKVAELEAVNDELEAFSYSVSHDLRAPLRHVSGFVDLLRKHAGDVLDEKSLRYLGVISDAARQMGRLIDDLLAFSRMGRSEMLSGRVALDALVDEVLREVRVDADGRAIDWRIEPLPIVTGDRSMLRIVLVNLLANAVKYTRQRENAHIAVGTQPGEEGRTVIFVRDDGVGFDMEYAGRLFGVFQRLHRSDQFEGTGIGLATVRRIAHRHGGRVWAEAAPDAGATFYVSLPVAESPA